MADTTTQYEERLDEIAHTSFGVLSDDQILQLLAERKELQALKVQYEQIQKEQEKITEAQQEKAGIEKELTRLNTLISPDKPDDELIHLIEERKAWEAKLAAIDAALVALGQKVPETAKKTVSVPVREETEERVSEQETPQASPLAEEPAPAPETEEKSVASPDVIPEKTEESSPTLPVDKDFGKQRILESTLDPESELGRYLKQIEDSPENIGKILDDLPVSVRRDKMFMLGVAEVDPAYAMHYADKDTLKKDEDFNLKVVSLKGKRTSGSVLAEMLPEARTEAVVMTALKQDYRNIRYALPQMAGYDQMIEKAKKAALDKVKELKDSVDVMLLVPKILQKDKAFMEKVEKFVPKEDK